MILLLSEVEIVRYALACREIPNTNDHSLRILENSRSHLFLLEPFNKITPAIVPLPIFPVIN